MLGSIVRTTYTYPAISPIRTLMPLLICAYLAYLYKGKKEAWGTRWFWLGLLISIVSVLWNTETGIACTLGFVAYVVIGQMQRYKPFCKKMMAVYCVMCCFCVSSILGAIGIVNLYNLAMGGPFPVCRSFFFPHFIAGGSFTTETIRCNPPTGNHAWVYILALLFAVLCWAVSNTAVLTKKERYMKEASFLGAASSMGIVAFVYYMNEAHWGCMDIIHQLAACLTAAILFKLWPLMQKNALYNQLAHQLLRAVVILAITIFSTLALNVCNDPVRISARHSAGAYSFQQYIEDVEILGNSVPEDTFGIGQGINMVYHTLGRKNRLHMYDTTLLNLFRGETYENAIKTVLEEDSFLISKNSIDETILTDILSRDPSYIEKQEFEINGWEFCYYVRRK